MLDLPQTPDAPVRGFLSDLSAAEAATLGEREIGGQLVRDVPLQLGRQFRKVQKASYDKDARTVTMAVSSEFPVERYFGVEVLSHKKGALRTDRLEGGVSLLFNHDYDQLLGRSVSYQLGEPLHVTCRFGTSALAQEKEADVEAQILVDVSIGYVIHEADVTEDKNGIRKYEVTDWELLEVSLVTVPADPTVGVGRAVAEQVPLKVRSFRKLLNPNDASEAEGDQLDDEDPDDEEAEGTGSEDSRSAPQPSTSTTQPTSTQRDVPMAEATVTNDLAADNKARVEGLTALRTQYPAQYTEKDFLADLTGTRSVAQAKDAIFETHVRQAQATDVPTIATEHLARMSEQEQRKYSRAGAVRAAINLLRAGTFQDEQAGFAKEVSDTIRKEAGERGISGLGNGILTPGHTNARFAAMEAQKRTIASGGPVGAVTNFTTVILPPIELLRPRTVCLSLGARMIPGLHGTPQFTRQNAAASSSWLSEGQAATNSDLGLNDFTMTPHRLSMQNSYYRDFLALSNLAIDDFMAQDRDAVLARSLDYAVFAGSGVAPVPLGLMNQTGLGETLSGSTRSTAGVYTAGSGGVPPTYVDLNGMEAAISTANADISTLAWATTPRVRAAMRSIPQLPGTAGNITLMPNSRVDANGVQEGPLGYNLKASTNVPVNYTANSVNNLHPLVLGCWDQILIGDWDLNEIIPDNITGAAQAKYIITEHGYYDTQVRHLECFNAMFVLPS